MEYSNLMNELQNKSDKFFDDLKLTSNNITNANTPGYKSERNTDFEKVIKNMEKGQLVNTNDPKDISLDGNGFFVLLNTENKPLLARNIRLEVDKDLYLKCGDNYIYPKTKITKLYPEYKVSENGEIFGIDSKDGTKVKLTELKIVDFPATDKLEFDGKYYYHTAEAGEMKEIKAGELMGTQVFQKMNETSNVNSPLEFMKFSTTSRQLRIMAQMMQLLNTSEKDQISSLTTLITS